MTDRHQIPPAIIRGRVAHKPHGKPYAYGCNPAAIRRADRLGFDGIDLDHRTNAEGHGWCFHQANPTRRDGWRDPAGIVTTSTPILAMSDADCGRLRYQDQRSMSVRDAMILCRALGLIPCFEDKTFTGESVEYWRGVKELADSLGIVPVIMSLPGSRSVPGARKLRAAHDAGLITMWLWRVGSKVPPFVDLVKSHAGRPIYKVSDTPVGTSPVSSPSPAPRTPPRRPVPRPWRRRTRRWKRRHPRLWRRIVAWRKAHPLKKK